MIKLWGNVLSNVKNKDKFTMRQIKDAIIAQKIVLFVEILDLYHVCNVTLEEL